MYILKREYGKQVLYSIINTRTGLDIGKTFNTLEEAKRYLNK